MMSTMTRSTISSESLTEAVRVSSKSKDEAHEEEELLLSAKVAPNS